jgi:cytochrome oxidase Cu insertion factor (SCO1/SenC/PrrC family)
MLSAFFAAAMPAAGLGPGGPVGSVYAKPWPAANFALTDQNGKPFTIADAKGKVVVLFFIYTHCADFCPFIAVKLKAVAALMSTSARSLEIVPVTTDPNRDTQTVLADYSKAMGMQNGWHFVTGPLPAMRKVWHDYFINVELVQESSIPVQRAKESQAVDAQADMMAQQVSRGLTDNGNHLIGSIIDRFGGGYKVSHDIPFWIVNTKGKMRVSLEADATPADIAADVRILLAEKRAWRPSRARAPYEISISSLTSRAIRFASGT